MNRLQGKKTKDINERTNGTYKFEMGREGDGRKRGRSMQMKGKKSINLAKYINIV